jgi:hypothetical protein
MSAILPALDEDDIHNLATTKSFERGFDYFNNDALFNLRQVGVDLRAHCRGSSYTPYRVSARLGSGEIITTHCTCPYDWGGICKHIVALLLAWIHTPEVFQSVAPTDDRLADKSKEELITLIQEMLKRDPELESLLDIPLHPEPGVPINLASFRRHIESMLLNDFPNPAELSFEISAIAETADRHAEMGNMAAAGALYHLILSEIIPSYSRLYDDDGDISSVLQQCAAGLKRCLTEGEPESATRQAWFDVLLEAELMDIQMGGIDLAYPAGDILLEYPNAEEWKRIEKRVRQEIATSGDLYSEWKREVLVNILVNRKKRTGREAEVTDLIFELGSEEQKAFELVRQGRVEAAISIAKEHFVELPGLVIRFADALVDAGGIAEAVMYITSQLETKYRTSYLSWLAQLAEQEQDPETALKWQLCLFHESPSLENYSNLQIAAQRLDQWETIYPGIIQELEADQHWNLLIEIALEEEHITQALEYLPRQRGDHLSLQVARAAETSHPKSAIEIYCQRVDRLIGARGRANYKEAAIILKRVNGLYQKQSTRNQWNDLLIELRQRHAHLPALMDELNKAGL